MRIGIGIGTIFSRFASGSSIDAQAQAHYDRVIADGGAIPAGLLGCSSFFVAVKAVYSTSDITTAISAGYDPHYLGYKLGAGSGTTLGQAAQTLYSCCGASGDVTQATAASQPLLLVHDGATNYYFMSRTTGSSCTANSGVGYTSATDTLVLKSKVFLNQQNAAGTYDTIGSQGTLYSLEISNAIGNKTIRVSGSTNGAASSSYTPSTTNPHFVRATLSPTGITYEWSADDSNWTSIGTSPLPTIGTGTTLTIGGTTGSVANATSCYYFQVTNNTTATNRIFNPATYLASTSQTQWTSTTGEVWTINTGTATTGYKGVLVDRTIVQGDGVDDTMKSGTITSRQYFTRYLSVNPLQRAVSQYWVDGSLTDRHLIYQTGNTALYNSGTGGGEVTITTNQFRLQLLTGSYNSSSSTFRLNTNADTTGTTGQNTSTAVTIFSNGGQTGAFSNIIIDTLIDTISVNNNTQKTAMYNAIRTFNNNAF